MAARIASALALLVFAMSLLLGMQAENTFATTVSRALFAMMVTFIIGLVVGGMFDRMARERAEQNHPSVTKK